MAPIRFLRWLMEEGRIKEVFDNLRNFLICGTIAYVSIHLILVSGEGGLGLVDRAFSWAALLSALALMVLNLLDGFFAIERCLGTRTSALITAVYVLLAAYVVLAMTTSKMHSLEAAKNIPSRLPFNLFP